MTLTISKPSWPERGAHDGLLMAICIGMCCLLFILPQTPLRACFHLLMIPAFLLLAPFDRIRAIIQTPVWRLVLAFMGWLWLSLFWSDHVKWHVFFEQMGRVFAILFFVTITAQLSLRRPDFLPQLFRWLLLISLATGIGAILWQIWNGTFLNDRLQAGGRAELQTFGAAMFGAVAVGSAITLPPLAASRWQQAALWIAIALTVWLVALTGSRGPLIALIVVTLAAAIFGDTSRAMRLLTAASLLSAGCAFAVLEYLRPGYFTARGSSYRLEIWREAWGLIRQSPLVGTGLGTKTAFVMHDGTMNAHPHNIFLANQLNGGMIATALLLALLYTVFRTAWTARRQDGMLTGALLLFALCCGMVDFHIIPTAINPEYIYIWLPVGLACAAQVRAANK
jgi:O-antigen ligase